MSKVRTPYKTAIIFPYRLFQCKFSVTYGFSSDLPAFEYLEMRMIVHIRAELQPFS